ncbi:transposase DNA-binding-containing protein, partial [Shewanella sp. SM20]|uniref:IS4/Tn5 family transposase DNA-binding protein n=1 Tax=Shewanella sp. SM20 TaxID=2912792 RepID=UPI003987EBB4
MFLSEPSLWAQSIFQRAKLGDVRRTKRLVQLAAQLAAHTGQSIVQSLSCTVGGSTCSSYRTIYRAIS